MDKAYEVGQPFRLLFVCTGNTCRSPMAEVIAQKKIEECGWNNVEVRSAGIAAFDGDGASTGAQQAAEENGLNLNYHRATFLNKEMVTWADLILVMSRTHLEAIARFGVSGASSLITAFADGREPDTISESVPDPVGGTKGDYLETFQLIEDLVIRTLERICSSG